jgi:hypothetical protein
MSNQIESAKTVISNLLKCRYPYDLIRIREIVADRYSFDEELAQEEMYGYCTEEFALSERQKHYDARNAAFEWLKENKSETTL